MKHLMNYIKPFLNWRFAISYGVPWMLTNGWAWIGSFMLPIVGPNWFTVAAGTWLTILWMPFTPEKLIIIPVAIWLHAHVFGDEKTHAQLVHLKHTAQHDLYQIKRRFKSWQKKS